MSHSQDPRTVRARILRLLERIERDVRELNAVELLRADTNLKKLRKELEATL